MKIKKVAPTTSLPAQVVNTYNTSNTDTYGCDYINGINGKVLWTNANPGTAISTSTISDIDLSNYSKLEVAFRQYSSDDRLIYTKFQKSVGTTSMLNYSEVGTDYWVIRSRGIEIVSNTSINIKQGYQTITGGTPGTSNNVCIPVQIIGYKGNTSNSNTRNLQESRNLVSEEENFEDIEPSENELKNENR